jgi:ubiquinone biosynthesis protein UbiJ
MTSSTSEGHPDEAALALAREVEQLRRQLGEVAVQLVTVSSAVNSMASLARQVAVLSQQVRALAERLGEDEPTSTRPALPSWFEVEGEQAEQMLRDLAGWVDTTLVRHAAARESLPEWAWQ